MLKHQWIILFIISSIASTFYPWLLVSSIGCLVIVALTHRNREKELVEAIAKHEESTLYCKRMAEQFNDRLKTLNDMQSQLDNMKSSLTLNFGRKQ